MFEISFRSNNFNSLLSSKKRSTSRLASAKSMRLIFSKLSGQHSKLVFLCPEINFYVIINMLTILVVGSYRFFFYSSDASEPVHVHIQSGSSSAKFWISPARLQSSKSFNERELREILKIVKKHSALFERKWHEYFNS